MEDLKSKLLSFVSIIFFFAEEFGFYSKRHIGMPFGLSIYMDGVLDIRVSSCCEYRHKAGALLGSKACSHFRLISMCGGRPCYKYAELRQRLVSFTLFVFSGVKVSIQEKSTDTLHLLCVRLH